MSQIPRDIDDLMWHLAESDSDQAVEDFCRRYPQHRGEMLKRLKLVKGFRRAKPEVEKPRFKPKRRTLAESNDYRWAWAGVLSFVAVALVFAGFSLYRVLDARSSEPSAASGGGASSIPVARTTPEPSAEIAFSPTQPDVQYPPYELPLPEATPAPLVPEKNYFLEPVTLVREGIALHEAIREVARQAGLQLQFLDGVENPLIIVNYQSQTAESVFRDMGTNFGFQVIPQTNNAGYVAPVRELDFAGQPSPSEATVFSEFMDDLSPEERRIFLDQ